MAFEYSDSSPARVSKNEKARRDGPLLYLIIGAGDGIRTHDPNLGKVVLYP